MVLVVNGRPVSRFRLFLDPFTVPFGGNGLAVLNLEVQIVDQRQRRAPPLPEMRWRLTEPDGK